ncbi:MAG: beta-carotene hydroxylase [Cytophagales bacterium]|nr:MAG: beta-carotene hydroxylase [Cytophagales bacterium]
MFLNIIITLLAFFGMEFMAWFTHKFVMHGFMWFWHSDHHDKSTNSWFERNDVFFIIYAIPGASLMIFGLLNEIDVRFFIGLGITLYGFTYFIVHDIFIHQRFKILRNSNHFYLVALRKAHKAHHKVITKNDGTCFGMLLVPYKYFDEAKKILLK